LLLNVLEPTDRWRGIASRLGQRKSRDTSPAAARVASRRW